MIDVSSIQSELKTIEHPMNWKTHSHCLIAVQPAAAIYIAWIVLILVPLSAHAQTQNHLNPLYLHESQAIFPIEEQDWQWFGFLTAVDGDTLAVGAKGENQFTGAVYIYEKQGGNWNNPTLTAKLTASDGQIDDQFGHAVSVSGNTVVVGTYCSQRTGQAYVFEKPANGWIDMTETAILSHPGTLQTDFYGSTVEVDGETIVIGAYEKYEKRGGVYFYEKSETGWSKPSLISELTIPELEPNSLFGYSLDLEDDILAVGCYGDYVTVPAYVFEKPETGWQDAKISAVLQATDSVSNDHFGSSVSITDNSIVVGAVEVKKDDSIGSAYIFDKPLSGWKGMILPSAELRPSNYESYLRFGISLDADDDRIVIGGFRNNPDDITYAGSVYVFQKPDDGWKDANEDFLLTSKEAAPFDYLGYSVVMQDNTVFTGSYAVDRQKQDCGAVLIHQLDNDSSRLQPTTHVDRSNDDAPPNNNQE